MKRISGNIHHTYNIFVNKVVMIVDNLVYLHFIIFFNIVDTVFSCKACYNHYLMQINKTWPELFNIRFKQNTLDINNKGRVGMNNSSSTCLYNMTVEESRALVAKMHNLYDEEMKDQLSTE